LNEYHCSVRLVIQLFVVSTLRLYACGELRHTHAESDSMYAVDPSGIILYLRV